MSSSDPRGQRFLSAFVAAGGAAAAAILLLGWLIDPFGQLHSAGWSGGACAPGIRIPDERYVKMVIPHVQRPQEIIAGSSRSIWGFSEEALRGRTGHSVANLAVSTASVADIDRIVRRALEPGSVRRVWIGVDFGAFLLPEGRPRELQAVWHSRGPGSTALLHGWLHPRALKAAALSLLDPESCADPLYTPAGFMRGQSAYARGAAHTIVPDERMQARIVAGWRMEEPDRERLYRERVERFEILLRDLKGANIDVIVFLTPSAPTFHELLREAGLTGHYARWRRDMLVLARLRGVPIVPSDDAAFLRSVAAQACPRDDLENCLFHDLGHGRPPLGEAIIDAGLRVAASHAG